MFQQKIENIKEHTEIIILPEMFNTGFSMHAETLAETMDGETILWMKQIAAKQKVILTGSLIVKEKDKYFNRLIWMLPNGEYGTYDKRHLFAYANEHKQFTAGNKKLVASVKGWKINLQVCYDLRFPVWARQPNGGNETKYDVLINVANWPQKRSMAWNTLLKARAIENQTFVIGVNRVGEDKNEIIYNGGSTIIDPLGELIYQKINAENIFTFTLHKEKLEEVRSHFPFLNDADSYIINI